MRSHSKIYLLHMPMRDGTRLATTLYTPPPEFPAPWPVALTRTPYGRTGFGADRVARRYAEAGFLTAVQDVRGRYESEGEFWPLVNEPEDGHDAVAWLAAQEDSDGRVLTFGNSYDAWTQIQLATQDPPGLAAMIPTFGPLNGYRETFRDGGALQLWWVPWLAWLSDNSRHPVPPQLRSEEMLGLTERELVEVFWRSAAGDNDDRGYRPAAQEFATHGTYDDFWCQVGLAMDGWLGEFPDIPILWVGGWYDFYPTAACDGFQRLWSRGHRQQSLFIGPWDHGQSDDALTTDVCGEVAFGRSAGRSMLDTQIGWARNVLGMDPSAPMSTPVSVFVMGAGDTDEPTPSEAKHFEGGTWRDFGAWPVTATDRVLHLAEGGRLLNTAVDATTGASSTLTVDPTRPAPTIAWNYTGMPPLSPVLAAPWNSPSGPRDVAKIEIDGVRLLDRPDCRSFWSEPLSEAFTIIGAPRVHLALSSSAEDCDVVVTLCKGCGDSPGDDYLLPVSFGVLRASHREGSENPIPLVPHVPVVLELALTPTAVEFGLGTRLGLVVTGSSFPRLAPNPQVFGPDAPDAKPRVATSEIHHAGDSASWLTLPLAEGHP
jgi:putative CocE/NonD family hydrolase